MLTSVWGVRGTELGRIRHTPCTSYDDGLARLEAIRTRRRQHGYRELTLLETAMQHTAATAVDEAR